VVFWTEIGIGGMLFRKREREREKCKRARAFGCGDF